MSITVTKARDAVSGTIERVARERFPDELTTAQSVAKFLKTPAGASMYELYEAIEAAQKDDQPQEYAAVEAIAEGLIAKGTPAPDAYARAFNRLAGH